MSAPESFSVREWTVNLAPVSTRRGERWLAYAEHVDGSAVPAGGRTSEEVYDIAKARYDRLVELVK